MLIPFNFHWYCSIAFSITLYSFPIPAKSIFASLLSLLSLYSFYIFLLPLLSTSCHLQAVPQLGTKATPGTVKVIRPDLGQSDCYDVWNLQNAHSALHNALHSTSSSPSLGRRFNVDSMYSRQELERKEAAEETERTDMRWDGINCASSNKTAEQTCNLFKWQSAESNFVKHPNISDTGT